MRKVTSMLRRCCDDVASALRRKGFVARKVMVKLRFPDLSYATKGRTLESPTDVAGVLYPQCVSLLLSMMDMPEDSAGAVSLARPVRLAGMSAGGLVKAEDAVMQPSFEDMFDDRGHESTGSVAQSERMRGAEAALDAVRLKYGNGVAHLGI